MGIKGILFIALAILGAAANYASKRISEKTGISELKIKIAGLITVVIAVLLLFIFGK